MTNRLCSVLAAAVFLWPHFATPQLFAEKPKEVVMYAPRPFYPAEARRRRIEGRGVYTMNIRPDGTVQSVAVVKGSGHVILDEAAAAALIRWRYHPTGAKRVVTTPITFTMKGYGGQ